MVGLGSKRIIRLWVGEVKDSARPVTGTLRSCRKRSVPGPKFLDKVVGPSVSYFLTKVVTKAYFEGSASRGRQRRVWPRLRRKSE